MGSQCKKALVSGIMADQPEIWKATPMADLFDKIQKLPDKTVGVPNFRRVPGYKVYCCGQPTVEGFTNVLNKVCGETYPKDGKIVWINMRQEAIVSLHDVIEKVKEKFPGLSHNRIPVCNSAAPL